MSFPTIENFDISIVKRTISNFHKFYKNNPSGNEFEFTFLLNSLIGLLFIPNEYYTQNKRKLKYDFLKHRADKFVEVKKIFTEEEYTILDFNKRERKCRKFMYLTKSKNERKIGQITLENLLNKMRNSIAHCHITPTKHKDSNIWEGIILRNHPVKKDKYFNFEVYLTQNEIKNFALFIASKYNSVSEK